MDEFIRKSLALEAKYEALVKALMGLQKYDLTCETTFGHYGATLEREPDDEFGVWVHIQDIQSLLKRL